MAEPRPRSEQPSTADLLRLLDQVNAGHQVCAEVLDLEVGGNWVTGSRRHSAAEQHPLRNAWGLLAVAWINIGSYLIRERGVEAWTLPPLQSRDHDQPQRGQQTEFTPAGQLEFSEAEISALQLDRAPNETAMAAVRVIDRPREPRYTLDEAKAVLEICRSNDWQVQTDNLGRPVAVVCSNCTERRPLAL